MLIWLSQNKAAILMGVAVAGLGTWILWLLNFPEIATLPVERLKEISPSTDVEVLERVAKIPYPLVQLHDAWLNEAIYWKRVHYILTVAAVVLSALVASGSSLLGERQRNFVAVSAAVATGLLATLTPYKNYEDFVGAWRIVNVAKLEYLTGHLQYREFSTHIRAAENTLRESRHYQQMPSADSKPPKSPAVDKPVSPPTVSTAGGGTQ